MASHLRRVGVELWVPNYSPGRLTQPARFSIGPCVWVSELDDALPSSPKLCSQEDATLARSTAVSD